VVELQRRCNQNRKRSQQGAICCPVPKYYLNTVSRKHILFADRVEKFQQWKINQRKALLIAGKPTYFEYQCLRAFWYNECQKTNWYRVIKRGSIYEQFVASPEKQQAMGVMHPGIPTVKELTCRYATFSYEDSEVFS